MEEFTIMKKGLFFIALFFPFFLFSNVKIALDVDSIIWNGNGEQAYDVFDSEEYVQEVPIAVYYNYEGDESENKSGGEKIRDYISFFLNLRREGKDYFITISKGMHSSRKLSSGFYEMQYQIYSQQSKSNVIKGDGEAISSSDVIEGAFLSRGLGWKRSNFSDEKKCYLSIPALQIVKSGVYQDTYTVKVFSGSIEDTSFQEEDSKEVTFTVFVPSIVQMLLGDSSMGFEENKILHSIDFGELMENDRRDLDICIRSNSSYLISIESENKGFLIHQDHFGKKNNANRVPYDLTLDGKKQDLSKRIELAVSNKVTDVHGERRSLSIAIGKVDYPRSGKYKDSIFMTCLALD